MYVFLNDRINFDGSEWVPNSSKEFMESINALVLLVRCCQFFSEVTVIYSEKGMKELMANFEDLQSFASEYSLTNPLYQIRKSLHDLKSVNWDSNRKHRATVNYFYLMNTGGDKFIINNSTVAEAAECAFEGKHVLLLNLLTSQYNQKKPCTVLLASFAPSENFNLAMLDVCSLKAQMIEWIKLKRQKRVFKINPKHGENGKGKKHNKGEEVSSLLCSVDEANSLLQDAISYGSLSELYCLDKGRDKFLVFKSENTQDNAYHGYHVQSENEIPVSVRSYLRT
jgi:hypothetical protein